MKMDFLKEVAELKTNEVLVVGVKLGTNSKTGKASNNIAYLMPWNDYSGDNGAVGVTCKEVWTNKDFSGVVVGDVIEIQWTIGFGDKPVIAGWRMVKAASVSGNVGSGSK